MSIVFTTNVVPNPRLNTGVAGWGQGSGGEQWGSGDALASSDRYTTGSPFADCTTYARHTFESGLPRLTANIGVQGVPVTPGVIYTARIEGMDSVGGLNSGISVIVTDASGSAIVATYDSGAMVSTANTPQVFTIQFTAPQGASTARVLYSVQTTGDFVGDLYATGAMLIQQTGGDAPYSGIYFDGDSADTGDTTYSWLGPTGASPSRMVHTIPEPPEPPPAPEIKPVATFRPFRRLNIGDYSVVEDVPAVDPSDTSAGVGQMTLTVTENDDTEYLRKVPIDLVVPTQGTTRGTIKNVSAQDGVATLVANSRLDALSVTRNAEPFTGTFENGILYYLGLVGIDTGIVIDDDLKATTVTWPGWSGIVWEQMKKACQALSVEIALVSNNVVVRSMRQRTAENYRDSSVGWSLDDQQVAQAVEGFCYDGAHKTSGLIYPVGGWTKDVEVFEINANETVTHTVSLMPEGGDDGSWVSVTSVQQPTATDSVAPDYDASSVYTIAGGDNLPYTAAQWNAMGGNLTVTIGEDSRSIDITITGPTDTEHSPYQISMVSGPSDYYSSLRLVGEGIFGTKQKLTMGTGLTADEAPQEVGVTVDNEFIQDRETLRALLLWTAARYSGLHTINVTTGGINRRGENGSYRYPIQDEFDAEWTGKTLDDFDTVWSSKTLADFTQSEFEKVQSDFVNQAFGNVAGARTLQNDAYFRIRSVTNASSNIQYGAEADTTQDDFDTVWAGKTQDDFDTQWLGFREMDFDVKPLRMEAA